ncbi:putative 3',5'-cyclic phosphodiesterase pde-5 isoform X2 [Babylonia areolata]|uniref:putative 3',5'-cyclic phosphodiesterase pde-5 isoform X2 n=1 Tax=Babylonia areolata TaxID=304850 RepID=UPI003FD464CB
MEPARTGFGASDHCSDDMRPEEVTRFLQRHPQFLEDYVGAHVNTEQLEAWLRHKARHGSSLRHHGSHSLVNGEVSPEGRPSSLAKWKSRIQASKGKLLQELSRERSEGQHSKLPVLLQLSACVASAISAEGHTFYTVDDKKKLRHIVRDVGEAGRMEESSRPVGQTHTVAAHVALSRETVRVSDLSKDERFPHGLGCDVDSPSTTSTNTSSKVSAVLALPVYDAAGMILGVVEFYRFCHRPFTDEEEEVAMYMMLWSDMFLAYTEMHSSLTRQKKLNDFLLAVTKSIFQDISMDSVIMKIMSFAQKLVSADRASIFLLDQDSRELYASVFDVGSGAAGPVVPARHKEIRFPMDKGVAGHVATTGEILNIPDAYADDRFNRDVDLQTGYRTKTILCMPIYIRGNVIGVVQMVNKKSGTFTRNDEESFETFAVYCGLALHHAKLYDKIRRSEQKYRVALEVLSYHSQATEEELNHLRALPIPQHIPSITDYKFSPWGVDSDQKPLYVLFMFRDLFSQMRYDLEDLMRFTLTVRRNYRNVPYHNWVHAFSVAHSMYTVLKTCTHQLTHLQCLALFVACLCHDLDHRGKTNSFMVKSASPLATVYSTSTMEHHHFNQTVTILQHEGHNIFKHLTSEEYKQVLGNIRHSILATDLALFFTNHAQLKDTLATTGFSWDVLEHRHLVMGVMMTACDLCAMFKPWDTQLDLVYVIMEEFWQQGDEEKAKGMTPMPMMDRDKQNELPQLEVGFILGICLPCYELLTEIIPETEPMLTGVTANLKCWQQLAEEQKVLAIRRRSQLAIKDTAENNDDNSNNDSDHQNVTSSTQPATDPSRSDSPRTEDVDASGVDVVSKGKDSSQVEGEGSDVQVDVVRDDHAAGDPTSTDHDYAGVPSTRGRARPQVMDTAPEEEGGEDRNRQQLDPRSS